VGKEEEGKNSEYLLYLRAEFMLARGQQHKR
jgi:hypothetical protein